MKINNNCARMILKEVEKIPFGDTITVSKLHEKISDFQIEDILNIVTLFNRDHYLTMMDKASYDDNDILRDNKIKGLTEKGFKTLDLIREDEIWNEIATKIPNFDNLSIYTLFEIANRINNVNQNRIFNLPDNVISTITKW